MPTQDNEDVKKQPEIEENEHKSETLLPIFNASYDNHMDRLDDLQERKAEIQDKISRSENKIAVLEEKAERLEATNSMLKELADSGKLPKVTLKIIEANEDKIKSIHERQISKLENSIQKNTDKISKLDDRIAVTRLKAQKLRSFSNLIKSFVIPNPTLRRELFTEAMNGLRNSTKGLLNIDMNGEKNKLAKLSEQYENADSMSEKYKLGKKIEAVKSNISMLESKINKLGKSQKLSEINDPAVDKTIAHIEAQIESTDFMIKGEVFDFDKPIETIAIDSAEYLRNAEISMEDDLSMIDGIINNGKNEERPDVTLFLKEIDFSTCDDATLQAFRDSAKANMECAKEILQSISQNYDVSRWSLNSKQALSDVREKFSDDRIAYVLANALHGTSDGRLSQEVKNFLRDTLANVPQQFQKRNLFLDSANPGLIDLFARTFMKSQAEKQIEKSAPEKKVGLLSFEQFGENKFRIVDDMTANDILKLANSSEKPFVALMEVGKAVSEPEFAEIMQSTQAKFSVDIQLDSDKVQLMAVNGGKGVIAEGDRNDQNTYFRTAKLSDFAQEKKPQQKEIRSEVRKINPDYYKQIPKKARVITNETAKVGAMIMTELEKQKIPFSAVETDKGVTITVSKENESAFRTAEDKAKDTHVRLVNPEIFKQIPKEDRSVKTMPESEAKETMQKLEKDGIQYSARLDGDKSAVTVRKSEAPAYFSRKQMKKLAQEVKCEKPKQTKAKSKGQELS